MTKDLSPHEKIMYFLDQSKDCTDSTSACLKATIAEFISKFVREISELANTKDGLISLEDVYRVQMKAASHCINSLNTVLQTLSGMTKQ